MTEAQREKPRAHPRIKKAVISARRWDIKLAGGDQPVGSIVDRVARIREGVPSRVFVEVSKHVGLAQGELAKKLRLSARTMSGRIAKPQTKLKPEESEKVLRVQQIFEQARRVFGSKEQAREWLMNSAHGLEGQRPIDLLDTELGGTQVREYLGAIEYGNYW